MTNPAPEQTEARLQLEQPASRGRLAGERGARREATPDGVWPGGEQAKAGRPGGEREEQRPPPDAERPLASYALLGGTYAAAFGGVLVAGRRRIPERFALGDLALLALGTHKLSRLITRDRVTRPLRAPFTEVDEEDPPVELSERATGTGLRRAVGELLSCPYCLDQWIAS